MRAGRIQVSQDLLLTWLQFPHAEIIENKLNSESKTMQFILEDAEMPEVKDHHIEDVMPLYTQYTDCFGNSFVIREPLNK